MSDLNIFRSGSAPPTIEGSINSFGSLCRYSGFGIINNFDNSSSNPNGVLSEDEIRSHPACLSYYYSHDNINPMLPTPLLSKEEWRMQQRFRGGNGLPFEGFADWKTRGLADDDVDNSPLFLVQPGVSIRKKENAFLESSMVDSTNPSMQASTEWLHRGPEGRVGSGCAWMCVRRKSFADILQVLCTDQQDMLLSVIHQAILIFIQ